MSAIAIARNAPCPCGSGRRFKDCHGAVGAKHDDAHNADALLREAQVAFAGGQPAVAKALLGRAAQIAPARADLLRERARVEWTLGEATAEASCRSALARDPADVVAWNLLGEILNASDVAGAAQAWQEALRLDPENAEALFHLGNRLREQNEPELAADYYERALRRAPGHVAVLNNLGLALQAQGKLERAEASYREVLASQPQHVDALANLACLLQSDKRYREAVLSFEKALTVRREFPATFWRSRATALVEMSALADAEASLREAARLEPEHMRTHMDMGSLCIALERFEEAEAAFERALALQPDNPYALAMLAYSRMHRCAWDGLEESFARLRVFLGETATRNECNVAPFPLLAMPLGPQFELAAAERWARQIAAPLAAGTPHAMEKDDAQARLRVGFVSSDFRDHPVAHLLIECWERIDRARIETFAYSLVPEDVSAFGARVARAFDHFVDVSGESAVAIARRIRSDAVDVLVDLNGYTTHAKSAIFALRAAPLQISWLGYLGTLGAPWYDYVLTDRFVAPAALQPFFTERFLYLPDCYCPSDTRRIVAVEPPSRSACALPEQGRVFCCFNNAYKILPEVFAVWMRLLSATPGSVLWLAPATKAAQANLRREAQARGVDPARLVFAARVSLPEHLARHAHAELFLDTTPYNAGTTANDALFMGVPVLTCSGESMASRVAGSQLRAIGLPELVTTSLADYEALALKLAAEPALIASYRARLAANRRSYPLFDMSRFSHHLDDLLIGAWEERSRVANR